MLEGLLCRLILCIERFELVAFDCFCSIREHLLHKFGNLSVTYVGAPVQRHFLAFYNNEVEQSAKKTVKKEVQLVSVKFLLGLEAEEQGYICFQFLVNQQVEKCRLLTLYDLLHIAFYCDDDDGE